MTDPSTGSDEREHALPSGLTVTVRSHRTLRRPDIHKVWAAGNNAEPGMDHVAQHEALMGLLVAATSDPDRYPVPLAPEALDQLPGTDYTALYRLMNNGWRLANGLSVAPNPDEWEDPTRPKPESNGTSPASKATTSPTSAPTGTTSTTTTTSTAPEAGPPQP